MVASRLFRHGQPNPDRNHSIGSTSVLPYRHVVADVCGRSGPRYTGYNKLITQRSNKPNTARAYPCCTYVPCQLHGSRGREQMNTSQLSLMAYISY